MTSGLLVMSYGTPERLEDVEPYYTHIRRGNPPPEERLHELIERYRAVGGPTALNRITRRQATALKATLADRGTAVRLYVGFKHVAPFVGEVVEAMAADGITHAVGLVLAPHYSLRSIAEYQAYAEKKRRQEMTLEIVSGWHDHPGFITGLARRLRDALPRAGDGPHVVFTAHSLPAAVLDRGDPYPDQLRRTAHLVAKTVGLDGWSFAYQSAGRTDEPWLGPDILETIDELADLGERGVVVQSIGFVADHLEVLYDLDIEARELAERRGLAYARAMMQNDDPDFIDALATIVEDRLAMVGSTG